MQSVRTRFLNDFEFLRWITYLFLGGAINASFLQLYGDFLFRIPQIFGGPLPQSLQVPYLILPLVLLGFAPLILSIFLTRIKTEKQVVPPLYISLVSLGWFAGFILIRYPPQITSALLLYGFFVFIGGTGENAVARYLLGIAVNADDFVWFTFSVEAEPVKIRDILETEKYRRTLGLFRPKTDDKTSNVTFKGRSRYNYVLEIGQLVPGTSSTITAVFYDQSDWYVRPKSGQLTEDAEKVASYLRGLFQRPEHMFLVGTFGTGSVVGTAATVNTERLVQSTMDDLAGIIPAFQKISKLGWAKIVAFIAVLGYLTWLGVFLQDYQTAGGLFAIVLLYLVFELRSSTFRGGD